MRRAAVLILAACLCASSGAPSSAAPRGHRSHRWRKADEARRSRAREEAEAEKKEAPRKRLLPGRWRDDVADALEKVLREHGRGAAGYRVEDPPVAVFSWDDVAASNHVGEAVFHRLVDDADFKFDDAFWERIPLHIGRLRIRAAYNEFHRKPRASWRHDAYYQIYRKEFYRCYRSYCREYGGDKCALWRVRLLAGFTEGELRRYARKVIDDELKRPVGWEDVGETVADPDPVRVRTGLRLIPEMRDLFAKLKDKGFDVWVLSSSNQWAVEELAQEYGVFGSRVAGIRLKSVDGTLTDENLLPVPYGGGMAEAVVMFIGRSPVLIVGGEEDGELLGYGRGTRVKFVDAAEGLPGMARGRGLQQPRFSPMRMPQKRAGGG